MTNFQFDNQRKHTVVTLAKSVVSDGRKRQTKLAIIGDRLLFQ